MTPGASHRDRLQPGQYAASKVPVITVWFWVIKVLTTAMGEATSDFFVYRYNPYLVVIGGFIVFAIVLAIQLSVRRYMTGVYWLAVTMVAVFGTMAADALHIQLRVPYYETASGFAIALAATFILWYRTERTLSIHSIYTRRRELFYWATVSATFALGTAVGDLTAVTFHLGYLASGVLFTVVIAVPALAHWKFGMNAVFAFWFAYVITRPLGASFADWMGKPPAITGLGWGDGRVAVGLTVPMVILVTYLGLSRKDVEEQGRPRSAVPVRPLERAAGSPARQRGGRHRLQPSAAPVYLRSEPDQRIQHQPPAGRRAEYRDW